MNEWMNIQGSNWNPKNLAVATFTESLVKNQWAATEILTKRYEKLWVENEILIEFLSSNSDWNPNKSVWAQSPGKIQGP